MMRKLNQLACSYHPIKLILIDDNSIFIENLTLELSSYLVKSFVKPKNALDFLQNYQHPETVASHIEHLNTQELEGYSLDMNDNQHLHTYIDLRCIDFYEKIFSRIRFEEYAIVVIDQVMPGLEGLEICKKLRDKPYKFIMLTAEAGDDLARVAFNQGLIDHFIKKDAPDFVEQLHGAIDKLMRDYFYEQSHTFMEALIKSPTCVLSDARLINTLKEYMQKNNIIEYYLLNETGSFLMLEADGKPHWFAVVSENEIAEDYEFASGEDYQPDPKVLNGLNNRNMMLFRISEKQRMNIGPDGKTGWLSYMHPAKKFEAEHGVFYYSIFTGEAKQYFDGREVFSYQQFLLENESS